MDSFLHALIDHHGYVQSDRKLLHSIYPALQYYVTVTIAPETWLNSFDTSTKPISLKLL